MKTKVLSVLSMMALALTMAQASNFSTITRNASNCACCSDSACDCCNHGNAAAATCCDCDCCKGNTCEMKH